MAMNTNDNEPSYLPDYIGHYKILQIVGMGGMGVIYKAMQEPLNRVVALKVLPPQLSINDELSKRFEIEAKAVSMLQHQNIVSIFEYGEDKGYRFFAMQYVDGENLSARIQGKKTMQVSEIIDIAKQICRGLRYAHSQNVVHRDIKPQNILIDRENVARLSDFGIAKIFQTGITMTGVTVGTPEYMSPEQAEGEAVDARTDIYSLGVVIYEMLTKKPPFLANNPVATAYKHVHEIPIPPSVKRRDTPKRLELIVLKALKKDKKERYQSAEELLDHLDSVDKNELVDRPTVSFSLKKDSSAESKAEDHLQDKRITDRRGGQRRHLGSRTPGTFVLFDKAYWRDLIETQWLSICLIAALAAIVINHLIGHK